MSTSSNLPATMESEVASNSSQLNENGVSEQNLSKISGNHISWVPECDDEKKPYVGQEFHDIESTFIFYQAYGRHCGFDVRLSSHKKNSDGKILFKYLLCSKAGFKTQELGIGKKQEECLTESANIMSGVTSTSISITKNKRRRISHKCGCPAMILLKAKADVGFIIESFVENHNHTLVDSCSRLFLKCNRKITDIHKKFILEVSKNCYGASRAHSMYKSMAGSYENVGATQTDFKNFSRDVKKFIGIHDADMILQKFKDKYETSNKGFRYEYEVDPENRLTRLFWADAKGRNAFSLYGDCVSFDATYRTNK